MLQTELFKAFETETELGKQVLDIIEKSVHRIGLKEFAFLIQKEPAQIRDALNGNGKYFSITWIPAILRRDPQGATELINALCDMSGKEHPGAARPKTAEEKLKEYEDVINRHGLQPLFKG